MTTEDVLIHAMRYMNMGMSMPSVCRLLDIDASALAHYFAVLDDTKTVSRIIHVDKKVVRDMIESRSERRVIDVAKGRRRIVYDGVSKFEIIVEPPRRVTRRLSWWKVGVLACVYLAVGLPIGRTVLF